jgi:hypothetical protein
MVAVRVKPEAITDTVGVQITLHALRGTEINQTIFAATGRLVPTSALTMASFPPTKNIVRAGSRALGISWYHRAFVDQSKLRWRRFATPSSDATKNFMMSSSPCSRVSASPYAWRSLRTHVGRATIQKVVANVCKTSSQRPDTKDPAPD